MSTSRTLGSNTVDNAADSELQLNYDNSFYCKASTVKHCHKKNSCKKRWFTCDEKIILRQFVLDNEAVILSRKNDGVSVHLKKEVWLSIADQFNNHPQTITQRNSVELRRCWENMKFKTKKTFYKVKQQLEAVGITATSACFSNIDREDSLNLATDPTPAPQLSPRLHDANHGSLLHVTQKAAQQIALQGTNRASQISYFDYAEDLLDLSTNGKQTLLVAGSGRSSECFPATSTVCTSNAELVLGSLNSSSKEAELSKNTIQKLIDNSLPNLSAVRHQLHNSASEIKDNHAVNDSALKYGNRLISILPVLSSVNITPIKLDARESVDISNSISRGLRRYSASPSIDDSSLQGSQCTLDVAACLPDLPARNESSVEAEDHVMVEEQHKHLSNILVTVLSSKCSAAGAAPAALHTIAADTAVSHATGAIDDATGAIDDATHATGAVDDAVVHKDGTEATKLGRLLAPQLANSTATVLESSDTTHYNNSIHSSSDQRCSSLSGSAANINASDAEPTPPQLVLPALSPGAFNDDDSNTCLDLSNKSALNLKSQFGDSHYNSINDAGDGNSMTGNCFQSFAPAPNCILLPNNYDLKTFSPEVGLSIFSLSSFNSPYLQNILTPDNIVTNMPFSLLNSSRDVDKNMFASHKISDAPETVNVMHATNVEESLACHNGPATAAENNINNTEHLGPSRSVPSSATAPNNCSESDSPIKGAAMEALLKQLLGTEGVDTSALSELYADNVLLQQKLSMLEEQRQQQCAEHQQRVQLMQEEHQERLSLLAQELAMKRMLCQLHLENALRNTKQ